MRPSDGNENGNGNGVSCGRQRECSDISRLVFAHVRYSVAILWLLKPVYTVGQVSHGMFSSKYKIW